MIRAFLFGLTVQLILIGVIFLIFGNEMIPMARSPALGVVAFCLAIVSGFFAWSATPHPSWLATIGLWLAGFFAIYAAIPVLEVVAVLFMALA